jgi:hypothetical protein
MWSAPPARLLPLPPVQVGGGWEWSPERSIPPPRAPRGRVRQALGLLQLPTSGKGPIHVWGRRLGYMRGARPRDARFIPALRGLRTPFPDAGGREFGRSKGTALPDVGQSKAPAAHQASRDAHEHRSWSSRRLVLGALHIRSLARGRPPTLGATSPTSLASSGDLRRVPKNFRTCAPSFRGGYSALGRSFASVGIAA